MLHPNVKLAGDSTPNRNCLNTNSNTVNKEILASVEFGRTTKARGTV
jgi:hypothetical protein